MKKVFTMLGVPLLVFLVATTQVSFAAEASNAGGEKAQISATVEGLTFQSDIVAVVSNSGLIAGRNFGECTYAIANAFEGKNNSGTVVNELNDATNSTDVKNFTATVEGLTQVSAQNFDSDVVLVEKYTADIKTDATGGAQYMPEEKVSKSGVSLAGKNKVENQTCTCANCIQNNAGAIGGNYS